MKNLVMFLGAVLFVSAAACSSSSDVGSAAASGNCPTVGATSKCSADAPVTQDSVDACNKELADSCADKNKAALQCEGSNQTCGSDNKTDGTALLKACASQIQAASDCETAAASGGDGGT